MENLISETNAKLQGIITNLDTIKKEYEEKLKDNTKNMAIELEAVKKYKEEFFASKAKVEKMNDDIEGFEQDYQNLVERFKDDELANILIAANKEISSKIEERKRKIVKDKKAMNELVAQAEIAKEKLVTLNAEKSALELCLEKINDACEFYATAINQIVDYTLENEECLSACFHEKTIEESGAELEDIEEAVNSITIDEEIKEEEISKIEIEEDTETTEEIKDDANEEKEEKEETKEIISEKEEIEEEIEQEEDEDDEDDDKTIVMDSILDSDELNISEEDIEDSLKEINDELLNNDDELDEDDSLYGDK